MMKASSQEKNGKQPSVFLFAHASYNFFLDCYSQVYWPEEDSVSVVPAGDVLGKYTIRQQCSVMFGSQEFTEMLASVSTKAEMLKSERSYLNGEFNPMDKQPPLPNTVKKEQETSTTAGNRKNSQSKKGAMMYTCTNFACTVHHYSIIMPWWVEPQRHMVLIVCVCE